MKHSLLFIVLVVITPLGLHAQEPIIGYWFKLFDKTDIEINNSNHTYKLKSLSIKGITETINDTVIYKKWDCQGNCPLTEFWDISQDFTIRDYLWIQIIKNNIDSMNIFLERKSPYLTYESSSPDPVFRVDSISFQRGDFIIKNRPKFCEWKDIDNNKNTKNIKKLHGSLETYLRKNYDQYGNRKKERSRK